VQIDQVSVAGKSARYVGGRGPIAPPTVGEKVPSTKQDEGTKFPEGVRDRVEGEGVAAL
jgi:hypothetical protein